jgi:hypothetical protein
MSCPGVGISERGLGKKERGNEGNMVEVFVFIFENRTNSVEIVLRSGKERRGRRMEGVNLIKIYCKHIYKCHNVSPLYNYCM